MPKSFLTNVRAMLMAVPVSICAFALSGCADSGDRHRQQWFEARSSGNIAMADEQVAAAQRHYTTALKEAQQIHDGDVALSISLADLASAYAEDGTYEQASPTMAKALDLYRTAAAMTDDSLAYTRSIELIRCLLNLGIVCEREKHMSEAEDMYTKAIQLCEHWSRATPIGSPNRVVAFQWTTALCHLMECYSEERKLEQARSAYTSAVKAGLIGMVPSTLRENLGAKVQAIQANGVMLQPSRGAPSATPQEKLWLLMMGQAGDLAEENKNEEALAIYMKCLPIASSFGDRDARQARTYLETARVYTHLKRMPEALAFYRKAADTSAHFPSLKEGCLHDMACILRYHEHKPQEAIEPARERLALFQQQNDPLSFYSAQAFLGETYVECGQYSEGEHLLSSAVETQRGSSLAHTPQFGANLAYLARARAQLHMNAEALETAQEAVRLLSGRTAGASQQHLADMQALINELSGKSNTRGGGT